MVLRAVAMAAPRSRAKYEFGSRALRGVARFLGIAYYFYLMYNNHLQFLVSYNTCLSVVSYLVYILFFLSNSFIYGVRL